MANKINEMVENEIALQGNAHQEMSVQEQFGNAKQEVFTSIVDDGSLESKALVFNAMNDTDYALRDYVGKVIEITNFVAHKIELTDERTGEITNATRCVFIDKDGKTYGTVSSGINQSMVKLFGTVGFPATWENPLPIKVMEKTGRKGFRFLTIGLALKPTKAK
jgi:hypothetical protein